MALAVAAGLLVLGGCVPDMKDVRDTLTAREREPAALVTPEEKDALGWDTPDTVLNSELQRLAMANQDQIYSVVQPYVERTLGREVEMTGIGAYYPYHRVNVHYRTVDEPFVAGSEFVGLERDGRVSSEAAIHPESGVALEHETVAGLYLMAYRDQVAEMRAHIEETFPHFTVLPDGYARARRLADPMLAFAFYGTGPGKYDRVEAAETAIYQAYLDRPDRTDEEWRELFESHDPGFGMTITVRAMLRDPAVKLTEDMSRALAEEVRTSPLFGAATSWIVFTFSNLVMRDDTHFHEEWIFQADPDQPDVHPDVPFPEWRVDRWVDGGTVESFVDGDPR